MSSTETHNLVHFDILQPQNNQSPLLDLDSMSRFRRELIWTVGEKRAHGILTRFGMSCGQKDALLGQGGGSLLHNFGELKKLANVTGGNEHHFELMQSQEAKTYIHYFGSQAALPQCGTVSGYLTGLISYQVGRPLYFVETHCLARGDSRCLFVGKTREEWSSTDADLSSYDEDNMAFELSAAVHQLQITKDRYQNLFEQSLSPIFIIDSITGVYLNANLAAEELTGFSREELLRMNVFDLCHPQEHQKIMEEMKSLTRGGRALDREISIVRKDGLIRVIAQSNKILSYGGQRVIQSVLRDISDLKMSEQKEKDLQKQLLRSERLSTIGRLAASVAHELKNPLGAIRNAIYYVRNALADNPILENDPNLKEVLKLAEEEVDSSVIIIGELLDFSRVVQLNPRLTQINELLDKLGFIVPVPDNVEVLYDLDLTLPRAQIDPERLNQVFTNMVSNAFQALPKGGLLKISTRLAVQSTEDGAAEKMIEITFEDNGMGIEPLHLAKIFEPLFTTKAQGTGLGLAISNNIVEKHGGVILVKSQVGKGTNFTIKLPLQPPRDA